MNNLIKKYLRPFLVLCLFLALVLWFRSFLMMNIIEPIAILLWAFWRIITSVNQNIYWMVLIVICLILVIRLVPSGDDNSPSPAYNYVYKSLNRVEHWRILIKDAILGKEETEYLRDSLKKLFISVIAQAERSDPTDLEEIIATEKIPLPIAAHRFLFPPKGMGGMFSTSRRLNIMFLTPRWFRRWAGKFIQQDTTSIDKILEWMESEMEISYDR